MLGFKKKLEAFGLKKIQARRLQTWIQDRMGLVYGANGRGGSGVFLELPDKQLALLTARHVALGALNTGEVTIGVCAHPKQESFEPLAIKIHPTLDAALLLVRGRKTIPWFLRREEWRTNPAMGQGSAIVLSGAPGALKTPPELDKKTISSVKILHYFTAVKSPAQQTASGEYISCDLDESEQSLPATLGGMSGGPAFTLEKQLVGTNVEELRIGAGSRISVQRIKPFQDLFANTTLFPGKFGDYACTNEIFAFRMVRREAGARSFGVVVKSWYYRSLSRPDDREGRVGIVYRVSVTGAGLERLFPLNVLSKFSYSQDDFAERLDQMRLHVLKILGSDEHKIDSSAG